MRAGRWLFGTGAHIYFRVSVRTKAFTRHVYIFFDDQGLPLEHRDLEIFKRRRHKKEQVDATNERHQPNHGAERALNYIPSAFRLAKRTHPRTKRLMAMIAKRLKNCVQHHRQKKKQQHFFSAHLIG